MPRMILIRLPNDHTSGTTAGKLTPISQVADNDVAFGMVVELYLSHIKCKFPFKEVEDLRKMVVDKLLGRDSEDGKFDLDRTWKLAKMAAKTIFNFGGKK